jgi:hypothetical protein
VRTVCVSVVEGTTSGCGAIVSVVVLDVCVEGSGFLMVVQEARVAIPATMARLAIIFVIWIMVICRLL